MLFQTKIAPYGAEVLERKLPQKAVNYRATSVARKFSYYNLLDSFRPNLLSKRNYLELRSLWLSRKLATMARKFKIIIETDVSNLSDSRRIKGLIDEKVR